MAVLTSETIGKVAQQVCSVCGADAVLLVLDPNGRLVHERGKCSETVKGPQGSVIAHDPLDTVDGRAGFAGLANIQALLANLSMEAGYRATISDAVYLTNPSGREEGNVTHVDRVQPGKTYRTVLNAARPSWQLEDEAEKREAAARTSALLKRTVVVPGDPLPGVDGVQALTAKTVEI